MEQEKFFFMKHVKKRRKKKPIEKIEK